MLTALLQGWHVWLVLILVHIEIAQQLLGLALMIHNVVNMSGFGECLDYYGHLIFGNQHYVLLFWIIMNIVMPTVFIKLHHKGELWPFFYSYPCWSRLPSAVSRKNNMNFLHNIDQILGRQLKQTYGGRHPKFHFRLCLPPQVRFSCRSDTR